MRWYHMTTEQWHLCASFTVNGLKWTHEQNNQWFAYIKTFCQLRQNKSVQMSVVGLCILIILCYTLNIQLYTHIGQYLAVKK